MEAPSYTEGVLLRIAVGLGGVVHNAYILMECLAKTWVKKEGIEKSIEKTGSKFVFGADHFEELGSMTDGYHKIKDDTILRGMELFSPAYKFFVLLPIAKKVTQKILIFEKD